MMNEGWKCPNCGKAHAPWMATCDQEYVTWTASNTGSCDHDFGDSHTGGRTCKKCGLTELPNFTYFAGLPTHEQPS